MWKRVHHAFRSPGWDLFLVFVLTIAVRLAMLPGLPVPAPVVHDEYSYLLGADTFARGRLANPAHPHWRFFETIHVLANPTYSSKYPPGQALILAAGQVLFGHPYWGVVLSAGLSCAAITWALRGWLPPGWAFAGGLFSALRLGGSFYWTNSYWGGHVALIGASLLIGAWGRLRQKHSRLAFMAAATGIAIVSLTRPYEGGLLAIAAGAGCAQSLWRRRSSLRAAQLAPAILVLLTAAAFQLRINTAVTGNALRLPYQAHQDSYNIAPALWILPEQPSPAYRLDHLRQHHADWERNAYRQFRSMAQEGQFWLLFRRVSRPILLLLTPAVLLILGSLLWLRRQAALRSLWFAALFVLCGLLLETWMQPHYLAPLYPLLLLLLVSTIRLLRVPARRKWGRIMSPATIGVLLLSTPYYQIWDALHAPRPPARLEIEKQLIAQAGRHVVLLSRTPDHDISQEWVYNSADIDTQRVVWANDLGEPANQELRRYYPGRTFWRVRQEGNRYELRPDPLY